MIPLTLAEIADASGGTLHNADPRTVVTGELSFDSRDIAAGGLFVCLRGRTLDGHDYAAQAVQDGAAAVLSARQVDAPAVIVPDVLAAMGRIASAVAAQYTGTVIALTGSAGKTSTKDILESVLSLDGPTVANRKSFNNEIGFPVTVSRVKPDSRYLVLEMGARGKGHIASLCAMVRPVIATVLGIGSAHIGEFGSRHAIAEAKAEIVQALPAHGIAVLYGDDPLVRAMSQVSAARVLTFGTGDDCDVRAESIGIGDAGHPHFTLRYRDTTEHVALESLYGRHNVTNALAAAATALAASVPFGRITDGLRTAALSSGGRMEVLHRPDGVTVINDAFNASPESVIAALDALADVAGERRRVAVLGEMAELGKDMHQWHDTVAQKVLSTGVTRMIGVGGEHAQRMTATIRDGGIHATGADASQPLAQHINAELQPHDVVLIKGSNALGLEAIARELATLHTA